MIIRDLEANPDNEYLAQLYAEAPRIEGERQSLYWDAFQELGTERQIGMTVGPIPLSKVWDWAYHSNFSYSEARALVYVIQRMDGAYLSIIADKQNKKPK